MGRIIDSWKDSTRTFYEWIGVIEEMFSDLESRLADLEDQVGTNTEKVIYLETLQPKPKDVLMEIKKTSNFEIWEVLENLEHRIIDLESEREQPKEKVARDQNDHELTPRRSVLKLSIDKERNREHFGDVLFLEKYSSGLYKGISLRGFQSPGSVWDRDRVFAYNMPAHIAEAIIAAAEKKGDC